MKLVKKLNAYQIQEIENAILGFGCLKAKDYEKERYGHLFLFSVNLGKKRILKKLFIPI